MPPLRSSDDLTVIFEFSRGTENIIHPESLIFYNSVNIAVGKQGTGKTLLFMREILKEFPEYTQKNTRLHTILIFDDIAYSKLFKDPYFESLITKNRHNNIITFFGTQKFTGDVISSAIRSQATSICIYNGFSPRELATINKYSLQVILIICKIYSF